MNRLLRAAFFLGVVAFFAAEGQQARAQWGWQGLYGPSIFTLDRVPYYSQFPPVYYSHPVPRPYGYSPYAYPPGYTTPERQYVVRQVIVNPYAGFAENAPATPLQPAAEPKPLIITNPFVKP